MPVGRIVAYLVRKSLLLKIEAPRVLQRRRARSGCKALHCGYVVRRLEMEKY